MDTQFNLTKKIAICLIVLAAGWVFLSILGLIQSSHLSTGIFLLASGFAFNLAIGVIHDIRKATDGGADAEGAFHKLNRILKPLVLVIVGFELFMCFTVLAKGHELASTPWLAVMGAVLAAETISYFKPKKQAEGNSSQ